MDGWMDELMNGWIRLMNEINIWTHRHDRCTCGWTSQQECTCIFFSSRVPLCVSDSKKFLEKLTNKSILDTHVKLVTCMSYGINLI